MNLHPLPAEEAEVLRQVRDHAASLLDSSEALIDAIEAHFRAVETYRERIERIGEGELRPVLRAQGALQALLDQAQRTAKAQADCLDLLTISTATR